MCVYVSTCKETKKNISAVVFLWLTRKGENPFFFFFLVEPFNRLCFNSFHSDCVEILELKLQICSFTVHIHSVGFLCP